MTEPLISCIVIFFNVDEPFFREAIASVLAQHYQNWELLLVDDGSTDESTEIARAYAQKYPEKVRYLEHSHHQNRGMSATRNLGISHARGEYITFLDADDLLVPNTLIDQLALLELHPEAAMVYGPILWWHSWTGHDEDAHRDYVEPWAKNAIVPVDTVVYPPTLFLPLIQGKACIKGMLIRRQAVEKVGGFEETFRGLYEDQVFSSKLSLQFPAFVANQCWYQYRQHPSSCCAVAATVNSEYWQINRPEFLSWLKTYLSDNGFKHIEGWQFVSSQLWPYQHPKLNALKNKLYRLKYFFSTGLNRVLSKGKEM